MRGEQEGRGEVRVEEEKNREESRTDQKRRQEGRVGEERRGDRKTEQERIGGEKREKREKRSKITIQVKQTYPRLLPFAAGEVQTAFRLRLNLCRSANFGQHEAGPWAPLTDIPSR